MNSHHNFDPDSPRDKTIRKRNEKFRAEINILLKDHSKDKFLKSIVKKCILFHNCYEPFEVISRAYEIGHNKILDGGKIANPEAWMKSTVYMLLRKKAQTDNRKKKKEVSLDIKLGQDEQITLLDTLAAPADQHSLFVLEEKKDEEEIKARQYEKARKAFQKLSRTEQKLIKMRKVENRSWDEIASKLKFGGKPNTLRQQCTRALKKFREIYEKEKL